MTVGVGTIFLACMAYKQIKESVISRKRLVALDLASMIIIILIYVEWCYGLKYPLLDIEPESILVSGSYIIVYDQNMKVNQTIRITEERFNALGEQLRLLSEILNDSVIIDKIQQLPPIEEIYNQNLDECKEKASGNPYIFEEYYNTLTSVFEHLMKKYSLSINEIKRRTLGILSPSSF